MAWNNHKPPIIVEHYEIMERALDLKSEYVTLNQVSIT